MFRPENLLIVGAGFSFNAGLPLASKFTEELLNLKALRLDGPSSNQVRFIERFVNDVFGEGASRQAKEWPELEDIFTLVDLSANTGHHLGTKYSSSDLRTVRRAIIVRIVRMLSQAYRRKQAAPDPNWRRLEKLFANFDASSTAVLSMNWDTVFEQGIARAQKIRSVDYGCQSEAFRFVKGRLRRRRLDEETLHLLKPHGSVNWLYCDACRETLWVPPANTEAVAQTLFRQRDWDAVLSASRVKRPSTLSPTCPHCGGESLGTRFATFSYRKALDFPMYAASWRTAEQYLKNAYDWVFVGYSMPAADFEFKHLLKRVQLVEKVRPRITVITGGEDADTTIARFSKFFGEVSDERFFFRDGVNPEALAHLGNIGVMRS